ncbi:MAG: transposase, partial [Acidimicrobiales bacterium]
MAETGADMTRFPSAARLASWAGVCPANHESAGRRRHGRTPPGNRWLVTTLVEAARAAARTKHRYFRAQYRQIARRRGPNKAAVAVAYSLLVTIWHILTTGERYHDLGEDYWVRAGPAVGVGARPVVADVLDPDAVAREVGEAEPEPIVRQLTALPVAADMRA